MHRLIPYEKKAQKTRNRNSIANFCQINKDQVKYHNRYQSTENFDNNNYTTHDSEMQTARKTTDPL